MIPFWKSGEDELIKWADLGSRDFHGDDISVDWCTFWQAERFFGRAFSVDCFASGSNAKCYRFFSKLHVPGSAGVDFFCQALNKLDFYCVYCPFQFLCKAVCLLASYSACGVVLLPVWPRSSFFSFFFPEGKHLPGWVTAVLRVEPTFVAGPLVTNKFFRSTSSWLCLLLKVDFADFDFSDFYLPKLEPSHCLQGGCEACLVGY